LSVSKQIKGFLENYEVAKHKLIAEDLAKKKKQEQDAESAHAIEWVLFFSFHSM
jgi:hypothetical protein